MAVGGGVFDEELGMLLQGTTAVVEIMNFNFYSTRFTKRHQFLLYGIPREGVADAENSDE
jgi:hypothetical protein